MIMTKSKMVIIVGLAWLIFQTGVQAMPPVQSTEDKLIIINESDQPICYVYISSSESQEWGADHLGRNETIRPGYRRFFDLSEGDYDIGVEDCDGNVLLLEHSIRVSGQVEIPIAKGDACGLFLERGFSLHLQGESNEAINQLQEGLLCYQDEADQPGQLLMHYGIGLVYSNQGAYEEALPFFEKALAMARQLDDPLEGSVLYSLGEVYRNQQNYDKALSLFNQALPILKQFEEFKLDEGGTYNGIGVVYSNQERYDEAFAMFEKALAITQRLGSPGEEGTIHFNIARLYQLQERFPEALTKFEEALPYSIEANELLFVWNNLHEQGEIYRALGDYDEAIVKYQEALNSAQALNSSQAKGQSLFNIGVSYQSLGQFEEALAIYEEALAIVQPAGLRGLEASIIHNKGDIYLNQDRFADALEQFEQALQVIDELDDPFAPIMTLYSIGLVYFLQGQYDEALDQYEVALKIARDVPDEQGKVSEALILAGIGEIYKLQGRSAEAIAKYGQALPELDLNLELPNDGHILLMYTAMPDINDLESEDNLKKEEAYRLQLQGRYSKAIEAYEEALVISRAMENLDEESDILNNMGIIFLEVGLLVRAQEVFSQALSIAQKLSDESDIATTQANLAIIDLYQGHLDEALAVFEQTLPKISDLNARAGVIGSMAGIYYSRGELEKAAEMYEEALAIARQDGYRGSANHLDILEMLANTYERQGLYQKVLDKIQEAIAVARAIPDRMQEMLLLDMLGSAYVKHGRLGEAINAYEQALRGDRALNNPYLEASLLNNIGEAYRHQGRYEDAVMILEESAKLATELEDWSNLAATQSNIGLNHFYLGDTTLAEEMYQQALSTIDDHELKMKSRQSMIHNNFGLLHYVDQDWQTALTHYEEALALTNDDDYYGQAQILANIGDAYLKLGRYDDALNAANQVLDLSDEFPIHRAIAFYLKAEVQNAQGESSKAIESYLQVIDILENVRAKAGSEQGKIAFIAQFSKIYELIIDLYLLQDQKEAAFFASERGRARAFLDSLETNQVILNDYLNATIATQEVEAFAKYQAIQDALLTAHFDGQPDPKQIANLAIQSIIAEEALYVTQGAIDTRNNQIASLISGNPDRILAVEQVQALLDEHTSLISYHILKDRLLIFLLAQKQFEVFDIEISQESLEDQVRGFRDIIDLQGSSEAIAQRNNLLYQWLIEPVLDQLDTHQLMIVPHGSLHYLPFAALRNPKDGQYLLERFTLTTIPSVSSLTFVQNNAEKIDYPLNPPLILGNPTNDLDKAKQEALTIASLYQTNPLLGSDATETVIWENSSQAGILHLAAHGEYNAIDPYASLVMLASNNGQVADDGNDPSLLTNNPNDGRLEVREIFELNLAQTDLVVLSACETQLGEISSGDEVVGLSRAFFFAGTPSVIATLWNVDDQATGFLMARFYMYLQNGLSKAEALRQAQIDTMTDHQSHPYFWSAFVLSGDAGRELNTAETPTLRSDIARAQNEALSGSEDKDQIEAIQIVEAKYIYAGLLVVILIVSLVIWRQRHTS